MSKIKAEAGKLDMEIEKGSTFNRELQIFDDEANENPSDLTGVDIQSKWRSDVEAPGAPLNELTIANGKFVYIDASIGKFRYNLLDTETDAYTFEDAAYDIEFHFPSGDVRRLIQGSIVIVPGTTRPDT